MAKLAAGLLFVCLCVAVNANTNVYVDSVLSPFADWGWGTKNASDAAQKHSGNYSYSFVPNNYNAAYFYNSAGFLSSSYSQITFWIYRTSGSDSNIYFNMIVYSSSTSNKVGPNNLVSSYVSGGSWPANTWVQATVNLASFPSQTYSGFWVEYGGGPNGAAAPTTAYTVYVDDVTMVSGGSATVAPSTTTGATATTPKAATTPSQAATTPKAATTPSATAAATPSQAATTPKAATTPSATAAPTTVKAATTGGSAAATTGKPVTTTSGTATSGGSGTGPKNASLDAYYTTTYTGKGTYYGNYTSGGNCLLDPTPPNGLSSAGIAVTVAIANYATSGACGMCLRVTGLGTGSGANPITGTQTVFVNNLCPSCAANGLDFGEGGDGIWDITWVAIPCQNKGNIQYIFKSGSSAYWIGLQPRNTVVPVNTLEVYVGGTWLSLPRDNDNYFLGSTSAGIVTPFQVRLTSIFGEVVIDTLTTILSDQTTVVTGANQFTITS